MWGSWGYYLLTVSMFARVVDKSNDSKVTGWFCLGAALSNALFVYNCVVDLNTWTDVFNAYGIYFNIVLSVVGGAAGAKAWMDSGAVFPAIALPSTPVAKALGLRAAICMVFGLVMAFKPEKL